jgi:hypothetical protein
VPQAIQSRCIRRQPPSAKPGRRDWNDKSPGGSVQEHCPTMAFPFAAATAYAALSDCAWTISPRVRPRSMGYTTYRLPRRDFWAEGISQRF